MNCTISASEFAEQAARLTSSGLYGWVLHKTEDIFYNRSVWLQSSSGLSHEKGGTAFVTWYITHNKDYGVPQLSLSLPLDEGLGVVTTFPNLAFVTSSGVVSREHKMPLISYGLCETLQEMHWVVHPCDTARMMSSAVMLDGTSGDNLTLFLKVIAPYTRLPSHLIPV